MYFCADLAEDAAYTVDGGDVENAVENVEEREMAAEQAGRWQDELEAMGVNGLEKVLDNRRQQARMLDEWQEAFQVLPEDGAMPISDPEEEALLMAESLWAEREKPSSTAAWHKACADKMGAKKVEDMVSIQPRLSSRVVKPRSVLESPKEPRRGEYLAERDLQSHGRGYSRTDTVWRSRVDDWMHHGGRRTRLAHPDAMTLTTQDPFPLGARSRGVLNWAAENALMHSLRDTPYERSLYALTKGAARAHHHR